MLMLVLTEPSLRLLMIMYRERKEAMEVGTTRGITLNSSTRPLAH